MKPSPPDAPQEVLDDVAREFEASLEVPKSPAAGAQWMLMPVGLIGSGKTTVVTALAKRFGLIRVSTDAVRESLKRRGYSYAGCREIAHAMTQKYLAKGYNIAVDGNTGSARGLEYNRKTAEQFPHVRQVFIHLDPPESFIVECLKARPPSLLFPDPQRTVEKFYANKQGFVLPDIPFVYRFDPSRGNTEKQLEEAAEAITRALAVPTQTTLPA